MSNTSGARREKPWPLTAPLAQIRGDAVTGGIRTIVDATRGNSDAARTALSRSLSIAVEHSDIVNQRQLLVSLHKFHFRIEDFEAAPDYAKRSSTVSSAIKDAVILALAHSSLRISLHLRVKLVEFKAALQHGRDRQRTKAVCSHLQKQWQLPIQIFLAKSDQSKQYSNG